MTSVSKQHISCCNYFLSGCWGKDFLIPVEEPTHGWRQSTLASTHVCLRSPERSAACGGARSS